MGLISEMHKGKGAPVGKKLPVPTTDGDDQVIAAKTGEYVLPPEVVAMIGVDKLDAMVAQMTGQQPGGKPAEMPEGAMHEMMEGEMPDMMGKGMKGHARGGLVSKFDGVSVDPFEKQSLNKYSFGADGSALDDSVSRQIDRSAKGLMQSDEVFDAARPELEDRMRRQPNGLISQLMGYANGGIIDDLYGETQAKRANLRGYNPQATIPPNATTNASPRAPELRNYTPEPGRVQPGATTPRISGLAQRATATATPSRTVQELDARAASGPRMEAAKRGVQQVQASRAVNPAKGTIRGLAGAAIAPTIEAADQFVTGADADVRNQFYNDPNVGTLEKAKQFGRDAAGIVLPSVGAVVGGGVGSVFAPVAGTAAGGIAGYGAGKAADAGLQAALGESALDRYKSKQPQQIAAAPQLTPKEQSDEIARRRAALEGPQAAPAAAPTATPTQAIAAAPAPATRKAGPISGLAARAQPAAPAAAPANAAPMDGAVEIIRGQNRSWAVPELGYQEVPDEVYRSGRIGEYMQAQSNNMMDRADPVAAELRTRLAEIAAQGDNSIRVSNATDRDGEGRGLRNAAARMELDLTRRALAGDPQAIQQLNLLRGKGGAQDEYIATTREVPVDPANPMLGTVKEPVIFNKRTGLPVQGGTVQSSSAAPQSAIAALRKDPKLAQQFDAKYGQGASAQYLNAR